MIGRDGIADERGFAEELKSNWEAQANGKPQKQKDELQAINRRLNELDRLIGSLYENFISGLLPEKQYKSLMKKYSAEQDSLESQVAVRFYERGDRLSDDYYAQYPFDKWIGA